MANDMWRPPVNRLMRKLDRPFFQRTIELKAARIFENKNIAQCLKKLEQSKDAMLAPRMPNVFPDPDPELAKQGRKCVVLRPETKAWQTSNRDGVSTDDRHSTEDAPWPHSPILDELVSSKAVSIIPYQLKLEYDYWDYLDIMKSILPDDIDEIPSGFNTVGHVAHLNLRNEFAEYKHIIAEVIKDKNAMITTVINKVDDVGEESQFRTFKYEVLVGEDDLNVVISEEGCTFKFDYSKVYWNTKLNTEHHRLVEGFREGEAVCDVMAGIGPFAVPAGTKKIFVWANDLNPESYACLKDAITRNKVVEYVQPFNEDGRTFIRTAVERLARTDHTVKIRPKVSRKDTKSRPKSPRTLVQPKTFQHFVMNLPASAITFLPSFIGLYPPAVRASLPSDIVMPLIHVYCFSTKSHDNVEEGFKICAEISKQIGFEVKPGKISKGGVEVYDVRDVAPNKRMFCASFRLPEEVAYRTES